MAVFRHPRIHVPGRKFDFQTPKISDNRIFDDLSYLQQTTISTANLSLSGAHQGYVLVYDAPHTQFRPQAYTPTAFGFGNAPTTDQVSITPQTSGTVGLAIVAGMRQAADLLELRSAAGTDIVSFDGLGNVQLAGSVLTSGGVTVSGSVLAKGPSLFFSDLEVIGGINALSALVAGPTTLSSLTVTGATALDGNTTILGNLVDLGTFSAGASTLNSLAVTGSTILQGLTGGQASFSAINLNPLTVAASGIGGLHLVQANAALKRVLVNLNGVVQFGTDLSFNGGSDFWLQNLTTGNSVLTIDVNDRVTLGSVTTQGGVVVGVGSGKVAFYGASPVGKPAVSGNINGNAGLRSLCATLASQGLLTDNTTVSDPTSPAWTWVNQGNATVTTGNGTVFLNTPAASGFNLRLRVIPVPAAPYTLTLGFNPCSVIADVLHMGLVLYNSASSAAVTHSLTSSSAGLANARLFQPFKWNSLTSLNAGYTTSPSLVPQAAIAGGTACWLQLQDDNTSRICRISADGLNWTTIHTVGRTDFMTPTHVGFYVDADSNTFGAGLSVIYWQQS